MPVLVVIGLVAALLVSCVQQSQVRSAPTTATTSTLAGSDHCRGSHWVRSWGAAPSDVGPGLSRQTVRLVVTPHLGGSSLRVRLTNRFGPQPVRIGAATVGVRRAGASVRSGTTVPLRFGGAASVTMPAGGDAVSDEVPMTTRAFEDLAVTLYLSGKAVPLTRHVIASEVGTYLARGNHLDDRSGAAFGKPGESWILLEGIDVRAPLATSAAVVAFGDSITDGYLSTSRRRSDERNTRYPDFLSRRLVRAGRQVSVVNAGISSNRLLTDAPADLTWAGPRGLGRLDDDVLAVPGVTDVIILLGINDLRYETASAAQVQRGLASLIRQVHAADRRVVLATFPPTDRRAVVDPKRRAVNRWIREDSRADAVVDFDAVLRDPADHSRLALRYDGGDGVHPSARGYEAMAAAVQLADLGGPCLAPARG